MDMKTRSHAEIARLLDGDEMTPEMRIAEDNLDFEKRVLEDPLPLGTGQCNVFQYETWDMNSILKGNYWGRSIYTTDKICKLFLKWNLERQKKYLRKKNGMDFDWTWILMIMGGLVVAFIIIMVVLTQMGVI